jgi:hypothetical protein
MSDLLDRIREIRSTVRPRPTFTLEPGRGETYRHCRPVLYAHSTVKLRPTRCCEPVGPSFEVGSALQAFSL